MKCQAKTHIDPFTERTVDVRENLKPIHHNDLTEEDRIAELEARIESLRKIIDNGRVINAEAWEVVRLISQPLTNAEIDSRGGTLLRDDFDQVMFTRMEDVVVPSRQTNGDKACPYCGCSFPIPMAMMEKKVPQ